MSITEDLLTTLNTPLVFVLGLALTFGMHVWLRTAGAPTSITEDLLTTFNISLVVRGSVSETRGSGIRDSEARYAVPRQKGIYK